MLVPDGAFGEAEIACHFLKSGGLVEQLPELR